MLGGGGHLDRDVALAIVANELELKCYSEDCWSDAQDLAGEAGLNPESLYARLRMAQLLSADDGSIRLLGEVGYALRARANQSLIELGILSYVLLVVVFAALYTVLNLS